MCLRRQVVISGRQHDQQPHSDEPDDGGRHGRYEEAGDRTDEHTESEREHDVAKHDDAVDVEEDVGEALSRGLMTGVIHQVSIAQSARPQHTCD